MTKKAFSELTPKGQASRLAKYEAQRKANFEKFGQMEHLVRLSQQPRVIALDNGAYSVVMSFAHNTEDGVEWIKGSHYVGFNKAGDLKIKELAYYANLEKGRLVSLQYRPAMNITRDEAGEIVERTPRVDKNGNPYYEVFSLFDRDKKRNAEKGATDTTQPFAVYNKTNEQIDIVQLVDGKLVSVVEVDAELDM